MKKLLMVGVSLMIILSLVACSKKENDKKDDANKPGIEDNVDKDNQENGKDESKEDDKTNGESNNDESSKSALAEIITSNRDKDTNDSMGIVVSKDDSDAEITFSMLGIDEKDMSEYAISLSPMNINAYCVAIVKPADGKKDTIKKAFETYKSSQEEAFEQYLQEQYKIAQDAVITEVGDYIVFAMCEDSSTFRDNVVSALKK